MQPPSHWVVALLVLLATSSIQSVYSSNLLIVLYPWSSRLGVVTELAGIIASHQIHHITILTAVNFVDIIQKRLSKYEKHNSFNIGFVTYEHTDLEKVMLRYLERPPIEVIHGLRIVGLEIVSKTSRNDTLMAELRALPIDVLIGDFIDPSRVIIAAMLGVQRIDIDTGASGASSSAGAYNMRVRSSYVPVYSSMLPQGPYTLWQKTSNILMNLAVGYTASLLIDRGFDEFLESTLYSGYHDACKRGVVLSIVSSDFPVMPTRTVAPFEKHVGPFLPAPAAPLALVIQAGLAGADAIIVVSPGSTLSFTDACSAALMQALNTLVISSTSVLRVAWKLTPTNRVNVQTLLGDTLSIDALEASGSFVFMPWIPQNDLLGQPATRLFVSHCGLQGLNEAVFHGVPVLCLPIVADQFDNAYNVRHTLVGDFIPKPVWQKADATLLLDQIKRVYGNELFARNMRLISAQLRSHSLTPLQQASVWVDYGLGLVHAQRLHGEALVTTPSDAALFLKPPEMFMSWMDLHSVDLAIVLAIVMYLIVLCLRGMFDWARSRFKMKKE